MVEEKQTPVKKRSGCVTAFIVLAVLILAFLVFNEFLRGRGGVDAGDGNTYVVNKSTGLYATFDIDANQIAVLSVGTELIPADGRTTLFCDSIVESGMTFNLCKVKVVSTGRSGWVLKQWID